RRRSLTRSISAMDGPTSRLPSSVTSSITNSSTPNTVRALPATQSLRDLHNSRVSFSPSFSILTAPTSYGVDPPRPAKDGYEWVWFPGGYWAERERVETPRLSSHSARYFKWRKKSGRNSSSRDTESFSLHSSPKVLETVEGANKVPLPSPWLSEEAHVASLQQPELGNREQSDSSPKSFPWAKTALLGSGTHSTTPSPSPFSPGLETEIAQLAHHGSGSGSGSGSEAVTVKPTPPSIQTRSPVRSPLRSPLRSPFRAFKVPQLKPKRSWMTFLPRPSQKSTSKKESKNDAAYTQNTLEGAKQRLAHPGTLNSPLSRISTLLREENNKSPGSRTRQRKLFGKSPWHRKASAGSDGSTTSSILDLLRGHTPLSTPVSEKLAFIGSTNEWNEEFPGGGEGRIETPPLRESTEDRPGRGFFFDLGQYPSPDKHARSPLRQQQTASVPESSPRRRRPTVHGAGDEPKNQKGSGGDPNKAGSNKQSGGSTKSATKEWWEVPISVLHWDDVRESRTFEFDMPEHLPNSPMCPANKKHKSGGTGVCVYHGRRKRSTPLVWGDVIDQSSDEAWKARNIKRESEG
ncbi:hypothetical protein PG989_005009, partial [Apiospora arundinis]